MEPILVSACLVGEAVRYNGGDKRCEHDALQRWLREGRVVRVCPEVAGGLGVPRPPAEIVGGAGGAAVLAGAAQVRDSQGRDVTAAFVGGAEQALALVRAGRIRVALLKEGSPSCGANYSYDGTFTGTRVPVPGVTTALLRQAGVHVFSETQIAEAAALLERLDAESA